jgi:hypothetical protein
MFPLWYQKPRGNIPRAAWYQLDGRSYENFTLDGYRFTKQLRGVVVNLTLDDLIALIQKHCNQPYDLARNTCHDARQDIVEEAAGRKDPEPRAVTRFTNGLRPAANVGFLASAKTSEGSKSSSESSSSSGSKARPIS